MLDLEKIASNYAQPITVRLKPVGDLVEQPLGYKVIILPVRPVMGQEEARKLGFNPEEKDWFNHYSR
ncbi:hypothetical protein HY494_01225 [Candidatus Woesearchaeota archaeon]|nr:hypothetical protein [Candidatus Woesearchaeota archaeon]